MDNEKLFTWSLNKVLTKLCLYLLNDPVKCLKPKLCRTRNLVKITNPATEELPYLPNKVTEKFKAIIRRI